MDEHSPGGKIYKITSISAQVNNPDRVNISVDGKYKFSLTIYQVVDLSVKIGSEYDEKGLAHLEQESQFGKLYSRALDYCLMRPHSSREVKDYLYKKTFTKRYVKKPIPNNNSVERRVVEVPGASQSVVDRVYDLLLKKGYVNDMKFAKWWAENRHLRKGASRRKLESELSSKGVSTQIISEVLGASVRTDEDELRKIIDKKRSRYEDPQKLIQYLARQGFSYEDIKNALEDDDSNYSVD